MAELGFKLDLDMAESASRGGRMTTGVYKVEIVKSYVYKTANGNNLIDLELRSENGEVGFINRICIDEKWSNGSDNIDYKRWMELAACAGMQSLTLYPMTRKTKQGDTAAQGIKELLGRVITVAVYQEHDVFENEEQISLKLSNTFLASGQSVTEAKMKKPADRILKIKERLADFHTAAYKSWKSGVTTTQPEIVASQETIADEVATPAMDTAEQDALFG